MSDDRRSYGNDSGFNNTIKLRFGAASKPIERVNIVERTNDCITCNKRLTGSIMNQTRCKLICGINEKAKHVRKANTAKADKGSRLSGE